MTVPLSPLGSRNPLVLDVFGDFCWPPCYIAKKNMDAAMSKVQQKPGVAFQVRWHGVMVDRDVNKNGESRVAYCKKKFEGEDTFPMSAIDRNQAKRAGAKFEKWDVWPNTFQAHRLMMLAQQAGKGVEAQDLLYDYTFERGLNISSLPVLTQVGEQLGLDIMGDFLASGEGYLEVEKTDQQAKSSNIATGNLPLVLVGNGTFKLEGMQPTDAYEKAFEQCLALGMGM